MGREVIADRGIWTAKKRYILNVHDNEGVRYTKPKLKIMGIEAIKSSTPEICRDELKSLFMTIMTKDEESVQKQIADFKQVFVSASPEQVAFPRGVNELDKWKDSETVYSKGTPIHVRGALLHNNFITENRLKRRVNLITPGDKIKFTYLKKPNPIKENVISFIDYLPKQLKLESYIDYDMQFDKTYMSVITPILDSIGWKAEPEFTLENFF
jgi:DNA polymerase elongation subunit (family B)